MRKAMSTMATVLTVAALVGGVSAQAVDPKSLVGEWTGQWTFRNGPVDLRGQYCGGCLRLVATIENPHVIRAILAHLGLPAEVPQPDPPQLPPADATGHTADVVA